VTDFAQEDTGVDVGLGDQVASGRIRSREGDAGGLETLPTDKQEMLYRLVGDRLIQCIR
jgi:hypothetical protein